MTKPTDLIDIAKEAGADIGTWDKSGNGANVVSFSMSELTKFAELLLTQERKKIAELEAQLARYEVVGSKEWCSDCNGIVGELNEEGYKFPNGTKLFALKD